LKPLHIYEVVERLSGRCGAEFFTSTIVENVQAAQTAAGSNRETPDKTRAAVRNGLLEASARRDGVSLSELVVAAAPRHSVATWRCRLVWLARCTRLRAGRLSYVQTSLK
jgi:hypothetical protein